MGNVKRACLTADQDQQADLFAEKKIGKGWEYEEKG